MDRYLILFGLNKQWKSYFKGKLTFYRKMLYIGHSGIILLKRPFRMSDKNDKVFLIHILDSIEQIESCPGKR